MTAEEIRQSIVFRGIFEYTQQKFYPAKTVRGREPWKVPEHDLHQADKYWADVLAPGWRGPYPRDWCGALALWNYRQEGLTSFHWIVGLGFAEPLHLPKVAIPEPGDLVIYEHNWHHAIVEKVVPPVLDPREEGNKGEASVWTIDGNQPAIDRYGPSDARQARKLSAAIAYYSIGELVEARLRALEVQP